MNREQAPNGHALRMDAVYLPKCWLIGVYPKPRLRQLYLFFAPMLALVFSWPFRHTCHRCRKPAVSVCVRGDEIPNPDPYSNLAMCSECGPAGGECSDNRAYDFETPGDPQLNAWRKSQFRYHVAIPPHLLHYYEPIDREAEL